jgi:predicted cobalt transporter CbtA
MLVVKEEVMEVAEAIVVVDMEAAAMEAAAMEAAAMEEDEVAALEGQDHFDQHQSKSVTNSMLELNQ